MSVKDIEVVKKARDVYLKLSKKGPYASNGFLKSKAVTKKEIDNAIFHDEKLVRFCCVKFYWILQIQESLCERLK